AVADLRAGNERRAVAKTGGRRRATGALGDVLVDLAVLVRSRAEALDGSVDHARVELLDALPGEAHAVEGAGSKVLDQDIAPLDQALENLQALLVLAVDGDRALVVVEHGEVQAVDLGNVLQLSARDVAAARALDLDHVGTKPGEQLGAGRPRLHVREVQ